MYKGYSIENISELVDLADVIREKTGLVDQMSVADMKTAMDELSLDMPTQVDYKKMIDRTASRFVIPNVTAIGPSAFRGCAELTFVKIPSSASRIGSQAFQDCSGITNMVIPNSVTNIQNYPLKGCTNIQSLTMPFNRAGNTKYYGLGGYFGYQTAIYNNQTQFSAASVPSSLKTVIITKDPQRDANSFRTGMEGAFSNCTGIENIAFGSNVKIISKNVCRDCSGLKHVVIEDGATGIDIGAFINCTSLLTAEIPSTVTSIPAGFMYGCNSIRSLKVPILSASDVVGTSYTHLGAYFTSGPFSTSGVSDGNIGSLVPESLKTVTVVSANGVVPSRALHDCTHIETIKFDSSVNTIGYSACANCFGLREVYMPSSITSISDAGVFSECVSLETIYVAWSEGDVPGAPWGAPSTVEIKYNQIIE